MKLILLVLLLLVVAGCASSNNSTYRVHSDPSGAQVYVNGVSMGVTPTEFHIIVPRIG